MSDMVGNPEYQFSGVAAHLMMILLFLFEYCYTRIYQVRLKTHSKTISRLRNEPRHEKTGLSGFRPGLSQTELYSHRR